MNGETKTSYWWTYLVVGILFLIVGGNFLAYPFAAIAAISVFVAFYMILSGACTAIICIADRRVIPMWGLHLALNLVVLALGILMFARPTFAINFMWIFCGAGFLIDAIAMITLSIGLKKSGFSAWIAPLILGIITAIASVMILVNPIIGIGFIAVFVTISVICFGINMIIMSFQLKPIKK